MIIQIEIELNKQWIINDSKEIIGETNFVISKKFLLTHCNKCPNYDKREDIENFLKTYIPEEDGQYLYNLAKNTGNLIEDIGEVLY